MIKFVKILILIFVISCGNSDPVQPDSSFLDGKWEGTYFSIIGNNGIQDTLIYSINIVEYNNSIIGTGDLLLIRYESRENSSVLLRNENIRQGEILGNLNEISITFKFKADNSYEFSGTLSNDSTSIIGKIETNIMNDSIIFIPISFNKY